MKMLQVLEYPQVTHVYDSLSAFDILVNTFLRYCRPTLIAPKVPISSGRVRFISPSLNSSSKHSFWIGYKIRMDLFFYTETRNSLGLGESGWSCDFCISSTKMSYNSLGSPWIAGATFPGSHTGNAHFALLLWSSINLCFVDAAAHK